MFHVEHLADPNPDPGLGRTAHRVGLEGRRHRSELQMVGIWNQQPPTVRHFREGEWIVPPLHRHSPASMRSLISWPWRLNIRSDTM